MLSGAAALAAEQGHAETSLRLSVQARELIAEDSAPATRLLADLRLSQAHGLMGDHPAALDAAEKALAIIRGEGVLIPFEAFCLGVVAEQRARCGDPEAGLSLANEGLALVLERESALAETEVRHARALCLLLSPGDTARGEIEAEIGRGSKLAERTQQRGMAARFLELRAELANQRGDGEERRRWLGEAERSYREMGATGHAERLARDLAELET